MELNELLKKFAKGLITYDEYIIKAKEIEKQETKENDINSVFTNKLERELKEYKEKLKTKSKDEIIDEAYKITVMAEIKDELLSMNLDEQEKEFIILQDDILEEFYKDWLDIDIPLGDVLQDTIEDSVAIVTRYYRNMKTSPER